MSISCQIRLVITAAIIAAMTSPAIAIDVVEVKTDDGLVAYLSEDHTNPIIAVSFQFRGGAALDPEDKLGLSYMVSSLLDEGAGDLNSFAFQSQLEDMAIQLSFESSLEHCSGSLTTVTANADEAFKLLSLALAAPRFDEEPVERIRRQIQVGLAREAESPQRIASKTLFENLFPRHPYGRSVRGNSESINKINRTDLQTFVSERFSKDRLLIGVAGDITPSQLKDLLPQVFGHLPQSLGADWRAVETAPRFSGTVIVEREIPQSTVYMAHGGLKRTDPDWYAALIADYILGGGSFASRLMDEVREKRGLAYGVSTNLVPYEASPLVMASVGTRNESVAESIAVIRNEWAKFQLSGPTETELEGAKLYLTGAWPLRFTSSNRIASILVAVQRDELGLDYLDRRNSFIETVTLSDVRRIASKLYRPEELTVVIVGQPTGIAAGDKNIQIER